MTQQGPAEANGATPALAGTRRRSETGLERLRQPGSWTLRSKLVASMLALFVAITLAVGSLTLWALDTSLVGQLDDRVRAVASVGEGSDPGRGSDAGAGAVALPRGVGEGFLRVSISGGVATGVAIVGPDTQQSLTADQLRDISTAPLGSDPVTVTVPSLGAYRLIRVTHQDGDITISGLPTRPEQHIVHELALVIALLTAAGLLGVGTGGTWLVRANLRPLRRVAGTATRVAQLPLDSGAVALADRVPNRDTDPGTEVGQVGAALNALLEHVSAALNARHQSETRVRQFVADASHELRTPLASIRGYAELSRRQSAEAPAAVRHALSRVESEATRMSALVDDLLLLARLDAGRPLEREPTDLTHLVIDAVSDAHAASPNHQWRLEVPDEPVIVTGDEARLRQVLANLLGNARTHTPAGTTVAARVAQAGDHVTLDIEDNGPGIPAALQPDVFERFARGDSSRSRAAGSTGLGLSIVSAVTAAHGGTVTLDSRPGHTLLRVTLPSSTETTSFSPEHHREPVHS